MNLWTFFRYYITEASNTQTAMDQPEQQMTTLSETVTISNDMQTSSPLQNVASTSGYGHWPLVYCLPTISQQLRGELERAETIVDISASTLHRFVRLLYEDIIQYTLLVTIVTF